MRKHVHLFVLGSLMLFFLSACSSNPQGQDPASVKVKLVTKPSPAQVSQKVKLTAQITGLVKEEGANVQFEIRKSDNSDLPHLLDAMPSGNGIYTVEKTFEKSGTYTVYIHLNQGELHLTKKKQLVIS